MVVKIAGSIFWCQSKMIKLWIGKSVTHQMQDSVLILYSINGHVLLQKVIKCWKVTWNQRYITYISIHNLVLKNALPVLSLWTSKTAFANNRPPKVKTTPEEWKLFNGSLPCAKEHCNFCPQDINFIWMSHYSELEFPPLLSFMEVQLCEWVWSPGCVGSFGWGSSSGSACFRH